MEFVWRLFYFYMFNHLLCIIVHFWLYLKHFETFLKTALKVIIVDQYYWNIIVLFWVEL